jgi:hypothetical protein
MATPPTAEPTAHASEAAADLRIERLLSRGAGDKAQVLLVLVSTHKLAANQADIWVGANCDQPAVTKGSVYLDCAAPSIEFARPLGAAEFAELQAELQASDRATAMADASTRDFCLARFDFSDHDVVAGNWAWLLAGPAGEPPRKLPLCAWRSHTLKTTDKAGRELLEFQPLPGHANADWVAEQVVAQPLFDLGVLFVHGIGDHAPRETLVHWSEPIVQFWSDRAAALGRLASHTLSAADAQGKSLHVQSRGLRNRRPLDGIAKAADELSKADAKTQRAAPAVLCAAVKAEETLFDGTEPGQPSAALLRLSEVDAQAVLHESHVLFAEAYWSREAFVPSFLELVAWLTRSVPIAVWARVHRLVVTRRGEIDRAWAAPGKGVFGVVRWGIALLVWLVQLIVMPGVYVVLALGSQLAVAAVSALGLLPIPWLRSLTRSVVTAMLGTLGQSYALQNSAVRRSAIVSVVKNHFAWLQGKCRHVVVMSHSQGAEVSRLMFLEDRSQKLSAWYSFGAGIAPLSMLEPKNLAKTSVRAVVFVSNILLLCSALLVLALLVDWVPGHTLRITRHLVDWVAGVGAAPFARAYALIWLFISFVARVGPDVSPQLRRSVMEKWHDYFASEDPVPGGSLIDRFRAQLVTQGMAVPGDSRIFNTRVALLDHTSYHQNIEQFVAPIALNLLRFMGLGSPNATEQPTLQRASQRRETLTWWNMVVSVLALAAVAGLLLALVLNPGAEFQAWLVQALALAGDASGLFGAWSLWWSGGLVGKLMVMLWPVFTILAGLLWWWGIYLWLLRRSAHALVQALAAATQTPAAASPPPPP